MKLFGIFTRKPRSHYLSESQIVADIIGKLRVDALRDFRAFRNKDELISLHFGLGMRIRNDYHLWDEKNPYSLINPLPNEKGIIDHPLFPDQVSQRIIESVWERVVAEHGLLPPDEIVAVRKELGIEHRTN